MRYALEIVRHRFLKRCLGLSVRLSIWLRIHLELKVHVGQRHGGVGFGNQKGIGPQIDLLFDEAFSLPRSPDALKLLDRSVRWILADWLKPIDSPRYALFSCGEAQRAAMNGVAPGKQNNLRVRDFHPTMVA